MRRGFFCAQNLGFPRLVWWLRRLAGAAVSRMHLPNTYSLTMSLTNFTTTHVVISSAKPFAQAIKDIQAEMGRASTETLGEKLSASKDFAEFAEEMEFLAGRSNFINVALLNWGKVMAKVPIGMKAVLFVIGNPLTARKLLEAGGPEVGLYLPTKIYVYEDAQGVTQVTYDQVAPVMAQYNKPQLDAVAAAIDQALANLADKAAN